MSETLFLPQSALNLADLFLPQSALNLADLFCEMDAQIDDAKLMKKKRSEYLASGKR